MSAKPSQSEVFEFCGPLYLTSSVNWTIQEHRRSVMASLVQGVYITEIDRQQNRTGNDALAPTWWEAFHFKCIKFLEDKMDSSIFGVIFEYMAPQHASPKYVIAIRGTMIKPKTGIRDIYLDAKIFLNELSRSFRCEIALSAVAGRIESTDPANVWLAGHSLGASIALQTGRDMVKKGYYLETYLFNPPFLRLPVDIVSTRFVKNWARILRSVAEVGLSNVFKKTKEGDPFTLLQSWIPYLFVNPKDMICCEYLGYFEHREKMQRWGVGEVEKIATKNSVVGLVSDALGRYGETSHLIPSAIVTANMNVKEPGFLGAHRLCQWWEQHSHWESKCYQYTRENI
ncbi:GDSL esterase/lipase At4g10955-like [Beta vulgaris subsp. vulgaris]|uniref:GDSL esterase/lipase At4g10955-like n=1 Tax=Beta vulgaris subsp. vulgaris TaxID=3555 RepID=UPI0025483C28|nr:GDSL esterase/lipase At4g10955-like [Beta vulgaris subsp. vulgaris]